MKATAACPGELASGTAVRYSYIKWEAIPNAQRYFIYWGSSNSSTALVNMLGSVPAPKVDGWFGIPVSQVPATTSYVAMYAMPQVGTVAPDYIAWSNVLEVDFRTVDSCPEKPSSLAVMPTVRFATILLFLLAVLLA